MFPAQPALQAELVFQVLLVTTVLQAEAVKTVGLVLQVRMVHPALPVDQEALASEANQVSTVCQALKVQPVHEVNTTTLVFSSLDTLNLLVYQPAHEEPPSSGTVTPCSTPSVTFNIKLKVSALPVLAFEGLALCHTLSARTQVCASMPTETVNPTGSPPTCQSLPWP